MNQVWRAFDPEDDWPPVGAVVVLEGERFTFRESPLPGWWMGEGGTSGYCRPFTETGTTLAKLWVDQGQQTELDNSPTEKGTTP